MLAARRLRRLLGSHARGRGGGGRDDRADPGDLGRGCPAPDRRGGGRTRERSVGRGLGRRRAVRHDEWVAARRGAHGVRAGSGGTGLVSRPEVTVGVDIGTSSVKAIAADHDGNVVARVRVPHEVRVPAPGRFEHDAEVAWRRGPREALAAVSTDLDVRGVSVAAMVPSLTAVDGDGIPLLPGLLYGDERGREEGGGESRKGMTERGELLGFMGWAMREAPDAAGFWPAQAVANHALCGEAVMDMTTAATAHPFFDFMDGWSEPLGKELGVRVEQMPRVMPAGWKVGHVDGDGAALASGSIDAMAEQIVAGADDDGDVLVILGTTLIIWAVTTSNKEVPGYWTIPHTA